MLACCLGALRRASNLTGLETGLSLVSLPNHATSGVTEFPCLACAGGPTTVCKNYLARAGAGATPCCASNSSRVPCGLFKTFATRVIKSCLFASTGLQVLSETSQKLSEYGAPSASVLPVANQNIFDPHMKAECENRTLSSSSLGPKKRPPGEVARCLYHGFSYARLHKQWLKLTTRLQTLLHP